MQGEQQDRLRTLAAQVAAESDAKKFHALLIELNRLLSEKDRFVRGNGKTSTSDPPTERLQPEYPRASPLDRTGNTVQPKSPISETLRALCPPPWNNA